MDLPDIQHAVKPVIAEKPIALIQSVQSLLSTSLKEALELQNLEVILTQNIADNLPDPDYIFCFDLEVNKSLNLAVKSKSKFLLISREKDSLSEKMTLNYVQEHNLSAYIIRFETDHDFKKNLSSQDIVYEFYKAMFRPETPGKIYTIKTQLIEPPPVPDTYPKISPLKIPISTVDPITQALEDHQKKITEVADKLKNVAFAQNDKISSRPKLHLPPKVLLPLFILFVLVFLPILTIGNSMFSGFQALRAAKSQLQKGEYVEAAVSSHSAETSFDTAKQGVRNIGPLAYLIGLKKPTDNTYRLLDVAQQGGSVLYHISKAMVPLIKITNGLNDFAGEVDIETLTAVSNLEIIQSLENLNFLQAKVSQAYIPDMFNSQKYISSIPMAQSLLFFSSKIMPYLPDLIGANGRRIYLVLLQNSAELRPSGGFIGSYALITLDKGKILDYKINDVYAADGQLRGRIPPPNEILHFLGQPNWYLRDSNWSPDFELSAKRAGWFLEKETGEVVDGVIGVDLYFVQKLLEAIGPVKIPETNDTITAQNFFDKAQYQAEINFFPGSTQKKDYLAAVGQVIIDRLLSGNKNNWSKLLPAIMSSLSEKHLQFYFANPRIESVFKAQNWAGKINHNDAVNSPQEANNSIFLVDANLGANKANYFVKRDMFMQTDISKAGELDTTLTVVYQNNSTSQSWPAGIYKNYLRFYLPFGSQILNIDLGDNRKATISSILDEAVLKKLTPDQFLVHKSSESGLLTLGTLLEVPINSRKVVTIHYRPPEKLDFTQSELSYNLLLSKQAGTENSPLTVIVNYPPFLKPVLQDVDANAPIVSQTQIRYNTNLSSDKNYNILWKKQF